MPQKSLSNEGIPLYGHLWTLWHLSRLGSLFLLGASLKHDDAVILHRHTPLNKGDTAIFCPWNVGNVWVWMSFLLPLFYFLFFPIFVFSDIEIRCSFFLLLFCSIVLELFFHFSFFFFFSFFQLFFFMFPSQTST